METEFRWFIGIDWGGEYHQVCVLDHNRRKVDDLDGEKRRLTNQLRNLLIRYFPAILKLCPAADEPWIWALLTLAPLPAKAKRLTVHRVEVILKKHRVRRVTATDVRDLLQRECLPVSPDSVTATAEHVGILIR